jgi:high-affinity iron transporter
VWFGTLTGLIICIVISSAIIGVFYGLGKNQWSAVEYYWEGAFALFAAIIITIMGGALLRVSKMQDKWRVKLAKAVEGSPIQFAKNRSFKRWCERYAMFVLPCITVLREGLEAVIFITGVSFSAPASSVPLGVVVGLVAGSIIGWFLYK